MKQESASPTHPRRAVDTAARSQTDFHFSIASGY
jgi:hypothetical protein